MRASITKTFNTPGTYTATVTVTSGKQTESDSASVTVEEEEEEGEEEATDPRTLGLRYMRREINKYAINVEHIPWWAVFPPFSAGIRGDWSKLNVNTGEYNRAREAGFSDKDNPFTDSGRWGDGRER